MPQQAAPRNAVISTREALVVAGLSLFAARGYGGARLSDIAAEADVTTGAFYGHFSGKLPFFGVLFERYADELQVALDTGDTLEEQFAVYILVSRRHRGAVRASAELLQTNPEHRAIRRGLRETCAGALAWQLPGPPTLQRARVASRLLVDVLEQYAFMEAAELTEAREPGEIAHTLWLLVDQGLYIH
jgi:AcrR family transcriptional regulator